jgi:hypothetical protein
VCTYDLCDGAGVCGHPANGDCGIGGTVLYYRSGTSSGGTEPSSKEVPNVDIDMTEDGVSDALTDTAGSYTFPDLIGPNVTVTTLDKWGTPRASDHNGAVGGTDAALIAQHPVLLVDLSDNQMVAADVTGNGYVSGLDASHVAQFAVWLRDHFTVATNTGSDWAFFRCDNYTSATVQDCGDPEYIHTPLTAIETDNFYAVLYGDVTGNWQKTVGMSPMSAESQAAEVDRRAAQRLRESGRLTVPRRGSEPAVLSTLEDRGMVRAGTQWTVLVNARNPEGILGLDLELGYDMDEVSIVGVESRDAGSDFNVVHNDLGGALKVTMYGVLPMQQSGTILAITVEAREDLYRQNTLTISGEANEGGIPLEVMERPVVQPRRSMGSR